MTMSGYPQRGNPILGFAGISDMDDIPYTTLSYANGPGYKHPEEHGERYDLTNDNLGKAGSGLHKIDMEGWFEGCWFVQSILSICKWQEFPCSLRHTVVTMSWSTPEVHLPTFWREFINSRTFLMSWATQPVLDQDESSVADLHNFSNFNPKFLFLFTWNVFMDKIVNTGTNLSLNCGEKSQVDE